MRTVKLGKSSHWGAVSGGQRETQVGVKLHEPLILTRRDSD
jgi:hypothetical protein